jgi:hypothetical protein
MIKGLDGFPDHREVAIEAKDLRPFAAKLSDATRAAMEGAGDKRPIAVTVGELRKAMGEDTSTK